MKDWKKELIEKWAGIEHDRWSKWQNYIHSKFVEHSNGKGEFVCLSIKLLRHWERQIATDYEDLSEREKESDREQVYPYIEDIQNLLDQKDEQHKAELDKQKEDIIKLLKEEGTLEESGFNLGLKCAIDVINELK